MQETAFKLLCCCCCGCCYILENLQVVTATKPLSPLHHSCSFIFTLHRNRNSSSENPRRDCFSAWLDIFHERWRDYLGCFHMPAPPVQNTRASPSCCNSSQRRFTTLCCRPANFGIQPTRCNLNCGFEHARR